MPPQILRMRISANKMAEVEEAPGKKVRLQGDSPPVFQSLQDFSQRSVHNEERYGRLVAKFEERYGRKPDFLARAPGRVNIIGEHIDYSGYAVLPMAIEKDIALACCRNDTQMLRLSNYSESYAECEKSIREPPAIEGHEWFDYFLCGYKGIVGDAGVRNPVGMDVMLEGNIPPSAGLSSSSALVCCAALATAHANGIVMPSKQEFAELCAKSERYIGTEGGGMDQAISFLGERNKAMLIEFNPIRPTDVISLPSGTAFVISNTRVQANKAAFASFNERVAECRLASMVVAKAKGLDWQNTRKLLQLQSAVGQPLNKMQEVVSECLHKEAYSRNEICTLLEISQEKLESEYLNNMTKNMQQFELYKRATHVFGEADRVYRFKDAANASDTANTDTDTTNTGNDTAAELGRLMDASHASCSQLYECSCPELDRLITLCKSSGALGSRLTGAGWGGCAVSLVRVDSLESFLEAVRAGYYGEGGEVSASLFATAPGPGAALCDLPHK